MAGQSALEIVNSMKDKARAFAVAAHGDQKYGEKPYSYHLDAVAELVKAYGDDAIAVAYLHDTAEDTDATIQEIEDAFGSHVAACVSLLTDEPGENRKERKAKTYAKLAKVTGPTELALVVKTADRLANVRACLKDKNHRLWSMYRDEHAAFRSAAYRVSLCEELWRELDAALSDQAFPAST